MIGAGEWPLWAECDRDQISGSAHPSGAITGKRVPQSWELGVSNPPQNSWSSFQPSPVRPLRVSHGSPAGPDTGLPRSLASVLAPPAPCTSLLLPHTCVFAAIKTCHMLGVVVHILGKPVSSLTLQGACMCVREMG